MPGTVFKAREFRDPPTPGFFIRWLYTKSYILKVQFLRGQCHSKTLGVPKGNVSKYFMKIIDCSRRRTNTYSPSNPPPSPQPSLPMPPRQPQPPPRQSYRNEWNYNPDGVGRNRIDSFGILQIKVQYRRLERIYHPDKYDGRANPTTKMESKEHLKLINNAYKYLRTF